MKKGRLVDVIALLEERYPGCDARALIEARRVASGGRIVENPRSRVAPTDSLEILEPRTLRGAPKLAAALDAFGVDVQGAVAVDLGASAGGFTSVLLERGAKRVYAVDAGRAQLVARLRSDARVVNLEGTNLGELGPDLVPESIDLFVIDLSYLALHRAVPQLERLLVSPNADAVALVKPMFELGLGSLPTEPAQFDAAVQRARDGFEACGWDVMATCRSPVEGANGAVEYLLHARRRAPR